MKIVKFYIDDILCVFGIHMQKVGIAKDGGEGSGNFGHSGRPGKIGGSGEGSGTSDQNKDDFLGEEFVGLKGQSAIDKLMKEKRGHVKGAFRRKDIGDIDLVWGNDDMGLQHIIKRRKKTNQPLGKLLSSLTEIIEKGELSVAEKGRFQISLKGKKAIIEPKFDGGYLQFLFTAYYEK